MKTLVVYYSRTGTTRKVAEKISSLLDSDIGEIVDLKNRRGFFGFLSAGYSAFTRKLTEIKAPDKDPSAYGLIVVGTPIWAGNITPATRTYVENIATQGVQRRYALFYTSYSAYEQKKAVGDFCTIIKGNPVAALSVSKKEVESGVFERKVQVFTEALRSIEK